MNLSRLQPTQAKLSHLSGQDAHSDEYMNDANKTTGVVEAGLCPPFRGEWTVEIIVIHCSIEEIARLCNRKIIIDLCVSALLR